MFVMPPVTGVQVRGGMKEGRRAVTRDEASRGVVTVRSEKGMVEREVIEGW